MLKNYPARQPCSGCHTLLQQHTGCATPHRGCDCRRALRLSHAQLVTLPLSTHFFRQTLAASALTVPLSTHSFRQTLADSALTLPLNTHSSTQRSLFYSALTLSLSAHSVTQMLAAADKGLPSCKIPSNRHQAAYAVHPKAGSSLQNPPFECSSVCVHSVQGMNSSKHCSCHSSLCKPTATQHQGAHRPGATALSATSTCLVLSTTVCSKAPYPLSMPTE